MAEVLSQRPKSAVALLKAMRPHVTVVIREAPPSALSSDLDAGRVDFIVGRITGVETGSVTHEHLYDEPIRLVTRIGHPAHALSDPTIVDLLDYPWILPGPETGLRAELEQVFAAQHARLPANRIECTSILTLRHLLADTDTITAMPLSIADEDSHIAPLPVSLHPVSYTVGISHPVGRSASPSAAALLQELRNVAAEMSKSTPDAIRRS